MIGSSPSSRISTLRQFSQTDAGARTAGTEKPPKGPGVSTIGQKRRKQRGLVPRLLSFEMDYLASHSQTSSRDPFRILGGQRGVERFQASGITPVFAG